MNLGENYVTAGQHRNLCVQFGRSSEKKEGRHERGTWHTLKQHKHTEFDRELPKIVPLRRPRPRGQDNIKTILKTQGCKNVNWIDLALSSRMTDVCNKLAVPSGT